MNSHFYCSLFKTLAAVKRKGQRSWSLLPWLAMLASLIGPTGAWAADVTPNVASVSVAPSNPAAATAMNLAVIFELDTDAAIGDTIDFDIGGTAVAGTDYTAPTAHPTPPPAYQFTTTVAGTTHRLDIALLAGSVAGNTISVTSNSLTSNIATLTTGGATAVVSGSIQVLDDTATNINNGETLPIEIGTTTEGGTVSRTFTISNTSTEPLIVDISLDAAAVATTAINITAGGALSPEFSIVDPDTATAPDVTGSLFVVPAGTDVDFDVQFSPPVGTPPGSVDSVITIVNSGSNIAAPNAPNFTFAIRGIVSTTPPAGQPEIDVYDGTIAEVEAGTAPAILDNTTIVVFPEATAGGEPIVKTFTIENPGTGDLSVTNLGFSPIITNFTRVDPFPSLVPFVDATTGVSPGRSEFQIQFDPAIIQPGTYEAQVIIDSNDSAFKDGIENPFNFPIQ
ncbi:MAG: hypothetical protein SVR94_12555, partial [Pseudomonadota bacterium]|nr:hypothetical protein [Pseudomonadota bacterium]